MSQSTTETEPQRSNGSPTHASNKRFESIEQAVVRFAGDSGDGMQLVGTQLTNTSAVFGNDVSTLPDYPAEIRAPAGTLPGVSGFQLNFSSNDILTPGDRVDALIVMNPAALKTNLRDLVDGGILIVNTDEFSVPNLAKAKYTSNPLDGHDLDRFRLYRVPITTHTLEAVKPAGLGAKEAERCKNLWALGLVCWLYDRPLGTIEKWISEKFGKKPQIAQANTLAIHAGWNFGDTAELLPVRYKVAPAKLAPGKYRNITGNQSLAMGLIAAAKLANKPLMYGTYPITPASDILHELSMHKNFDVRTVQAEDEIAAVCSAIGASFAGAIGVTGSSGPGIALKQEAIGLAVMTELPLVVVDVQRAGPSTGMPTKFEQSDLFQTVLGRNGECPAPVIAAQSPADCFDAAIEAVRVAIKYMTPVFLLSDGYVANSSEPWRIPKASELAKIEVKHAKDPASFKPYQRDAAGARPWAIPGTADLRHRIGGIEKEDVTGNISYDPVNHQKMTDLRAQKVANVANDIAPQAIHGDQSGDLMVVSWGGTFGAVRSAVDASRKAGKSVSHMHIRWINPFPKNVGDVLRRFKKVLVCELNMGQLQFVIRGRFAIDALGLHKVQGRPFGVAEVVSKIDEVLGGGR